MSGINGVGNQYPIGRVPGAAPPRPGETSAAQPQQALRSSDRLELSGMSHLLRTLKSNDIRTDKVAAIKAQIEAGTYDEDARLDGAIDRLLDDLNR